MKLRTTVWGIAALCATVMVADRVLSQDHSGHDHAAGEGTHKIATHELTPEQMQQHMEEYMKLTMPGEPQKHLERFVGTWKTTTRVWMEGPGSAPTESPGTSTKKLVLGGRYIMEEHKGTMMGMPYEGIGMTGYDNYKNMYISTWASNMSTELLISKGTRHPQTGVFTFFGDMDEPGMKITGRTVKYVTTVVNDDKHIFRIYDLHAGDDYKVIEIEYAREK